MPFKNSISVLVMCIVPDPVDPDQCGSVLENVVSNMSFSVMKTGTTWRRSRLSASCATSSSRASRDSARRWRPPPRASSSSTLPSEI
jgi:hypothetical protein